MSGRARTIAIENFWGGFVPQDFFKRHPCARSLFELGEGSDVDVVIYSCFTPQGLRQPDIPPGPYVRVFYTAENVRPDLSRCEFAVSFAHDQPRDRHLRLPNYVPRAAMEHHSLVECIRPRTHRQIDDILSAKRFFCAHIYRKPVVLRDRLMALLSQYRQVDGLGHHLNTVGSILPWGEKIAALREYKFAFAFENSSTPGYVTEKLVDAYVAGSVPLYWGDPEVDRFMNPDSMMIMTDDASLEEFIERIVEVDRDDAKLRRILREPLFKPEAQADHLDDSVVLNFLQKIADAVPRFRQRAGLPWPSRAGNPSAP